MKHLDLFSGIGGFALAARQVWGDQHNIVGFCDNDRFCQNVLRKNFPGAPIFEDIRTLTNPNGTRLERGNISGSGHANYTGYVDLITGGFPCQPYSQAGKRRGPEDGRHLWPEMLRVIQEFQPSWVIAENVGGLITWSGGLVFEQICLDLEAAGYEVQPFVIPACATNAPHRRDRVWIVAHAKDERIDRLGLERQPDTQATEPSGNHSATTDTRRQRRQARLEQDIRSKEPEPEPENYDYPDWSRDWQEVAFATCDAGMDDGLPRRLVRLPDGTTISRAEWRNEAIKAYGNAIVPQVAMEIMKQIKDLLPGA